MFMLSGCGRDLSTPSSRLVGHWKTVPYELTEYYFSNIDSETGKGTITEYDPGSGTAFIGVYTIYSEIPDGDTVTLFVDWPLFTDLWEIRIPSEGMSGFMRNFKIEYVDSETKY